LNSECNVIEGEMTQPGREAGEKTFGPEGKEDAAWYGCQCKGEGGDKTRTR